MCMCFLFGFMWWYLSVIIFPPVCHHASTKTSECISMKSDAVSIRLRSRWGDLSGALSFPTIWQLCFVMKLMKLDCKTLNGSKQKWQYVISSWKGCNILTVFISLMCQCVSVICPGCRWDEELEPPAESTDNQIELRISNQGTDLPQHPTDTGIEYDVAEVFENALISNRSVSV